MKPISQMTKEVIRQTVLFSTTSNILTLTLIEQILSALSLHQKKAIIFVIYTYLLLINLLSFSILMTAQTALAPNNTCLALKKL